MPALDEASRHRIARAAGAQAAAEARSRTCSEAAPDAIIVADADGRIVLANAQVTRWFGYTSAELQGQPVECLVPVRLREGHLRHRAGYVVAPRTRPMGAGLELAARRKDGSEFPVEISLSPIETEAGTLVTAVIRDVTRRREAGAERERLLLQEREARAAAEGAAAARRASRPSRKPSPTPTRPPG